ncbi:MAG: hypothetical protein NC822_03440 [Candidatus Omnitrophica bacterium]|nr:hypothetical protein [Candidatus Omnitrophota bacterium]MCM8827117.1 hypothetical protein [Candidatus Omnitrophota bacterium]
MGESVKQRNFGVEVFLRLLGREDIIVTLYKFYKRLPRVIFSFQPSLIKIIEKSFYRVTFAALGQNKGGQIDIIFPIEKDKGGYFFPLPELDISSKLSSLNGRIDQKLVLQDIISRFHKGIDVFVNLPIFSQLVSLSQNLSQGFSLEDYIKNFTKTILSQQVSQYKQVDIFKNILIYERKLLPLMRISALFIDGLYFDVNNLFLGEFTNSYIKKVIMERIGGLLSEETKIGFFIALFEPHLYSIIKREKSSYLESRIPIIDNNLYLPLALWVYRQRIMLDYRMDRKGFKYFTDIKQEEFLSYINDEKYRNYIDMVKERKDIRSILYPVIFEIKKFSPNPLAIVNYLEFISLCKDKGETYMKRVSTKEFLSLWLHAFELGWDKELVKYLSTVLELIKYPHIVSLMMKQKSVHLILLFEHSGFVNYFKNHSIDDCDFDSLYKIFSRDKGLFEQIFPYLHLKEEKFIYRMAKLLEDADVVNSGILLNSGVKKFINSLEIYESWQAKNIVCLLQNFPFAQDVIKYGYASFSGNIEDIEDKLGFSLWFCHNKEELIKKISLARISDFYLGGLSDIKLREAFIKFIQKYGQEVCNKIMEDIKYVRGEGEIKKDSYLRIIDLLVSIDHAHRLCRRREVVEFIQFVAETFLEKDWEEFFKKFVHINGSSWEDYQEFFKAYNVNIILKAMRTKCDISQIKIIVDTYSNLKEERQIVLCERLLNLLKNKKLCLELVEKMCAHIIKKNYAITEFGIVQIENEKSPTTIIDLLNRYENDDDFQKKFLQI